MTLPKILDLEVEAEAPSAATDRDLTYKVGPWDRFVFDDLVQEDRELLADAIERYEGSEWPAFVRETFSRLYGSPEKLDPIPLGAEWAAPLHEVLDTLPEWRQLIEECKGDADLAAASAALLSTEVEMPDAPPASPTKAADDAAQAGAEGDAEGAAEAHARMVQSLIESQTNAEMLDRADERSALRRGLRELVTEALDDARAVKQAVGMLGCGNEPSAEERRAWATRVRQNAKLVDIARLAGRMEAVLQAERAEVPDDGREDTIGVKLGREIGEALPMERALFAHPVFGAVQIAKLAEGRLLSHHQVGTATEEKAGRGPLIFALDESGSMRGEPDTVGKAIALTLARVCARERRTFAFVHFSTSSTMTVYPKGERFGERIVDDLERFMNGGTDIAAALRDCARIVRGEQPEMPREDAERADVVLITDALDYEMRGIGQAAEELAATHARLWTFHVTRGVAMPNAALHEASTRYVQIGALRESDGATLALSIHEAVG